MFFLFLSFLWLRMAIICSEKRTVWPKSQLSYVLYELIKLIANEKAENISYEMWK